MFDTEVEESSETSSPFWTVGPAVDSNMASRRSNFENPCAPGTHVFVEFVTLGLGKSYNLVHIPRAMSITAEYQKSLGQAARGALRSLVADHPNTAVADLRELVAENPSLGGMTLTELLGREEAKPAPAARRGRPAKREAAPASPTPSKKAAEATPAKAGEWETRTEEGRAALDRAVLESLSAFGGVGVSAEAIRARLGATPAQIRTSLNRHIEAGEVSFSGKARGTRYTLEA